MILIVKGIAIPVNLDENTFTPMLLCNALDFYPEFIRLSKLDWSIQGYFCEVCKEVNKAKVWDGDVIESFFSLHTLDELAKWFESKIPKQEEIPHE